MLYNKEKKKIALFEYMNMKILIPILFIFFSLFTTSNLISQNENKIKPETINHNLDSIALNATYIDIIGHHLGYCVNYERTIFFFNSIISDYIFIIPRVGFTMNLYDVSLPFILSINFGNIHRLELGVGLFYEFDNVDWKDNNKSFNERIKWIINIGYRYQKPGGGFVCRIGISPFFPSKSFNYFAGPSFGYAW